MEGDQANLKSQYEDYNTTSKLYDITRVPVGVSDIRAALAESPFAGEHSILDVACGTGNYTLPIAEDCKHVQCVELNDGMIEQIKRKVSERGIKNIDVQKGFAQELPFPDDSFTAVTCTMAVHHFGIDGVSKFVKEAARVVKPGGSVIVNHCLPEQLKTYWFHYFFPTTYENMKARLVTNEQLEEFAEGKLKRKAVYVHKETVVRLDKFSDPIFMTSEEGQAQLSDWAMTSKEEKEKAIADIHKLVEDGKWKDWYAENVEALLEKVGHAVTFVLTK